MSGSVPLVIRDASPLNRSLTTNIEARFRLDLSKFSMQRTRLRTVRFICDYTT